MYISRGYESQAKLMMNQMNMANERAFVHQSRITSGDSFKGRFDNPADVLKASRAEAVMRGNLAAEQNIQDALSFLQVKENGLAKMDDLGQRLRELSVQYANDTLTQSDREAMALEAKSLLEEMDYTMKNTTFNQINVFGDKPVNIQSGDHSGDTLSIQPTSLQFDQTKGNVEETLQPPRIENGTGQPTPDEKEVGQGTELPDGSDTGSGTNGQTNGGSTTVTTITETTTTTTTTNQPSSSSGSGGLLGVIGGILDGVLGLVGDALTGPKTEGGGQTTETSTTTTIIVETTTGNGNVGDGETDGQESVGDGVEGGEGAGGTNGTTLPNGESAGSSEWLSPEFIDEFILNPIAKERAKIGIESNRFEYRLESVMDEGVQAMNHLSRIRDADIAKEYMEMAKQKMLAEVNANMLSRSMDDRRNMVLALLS